MKKILVKNKILPIILLLILIYTLVGFFAVPAIIKSYLPDISKKSINRDMHIGNVKFNPYSFTLDMNKINLVDSQKETLISIDSLHINIKITGFLTLAITFDEIGLYKPFINVSRLPNGKFSFSDILELLKDESPSKKEDESITPIKIDQFNLVDGKFDFTDKKDKKDKKLSFSPMNFNISNFATEINKGENNNYDFKAVGPEGSIFHWTGGFQLVPFQSAGQMEITKIKLSQFNDFIPSTIQLKLDSGLFSFKTDYIINESPEIRLQLKDGSYNLENLSVTSLLDSASYPIQLDSLAISKLNIDTKSRDLHISSISTNGFNLNTKYTKDGTIRLLDHIKLLNDSLVNSDSLKQAKITTLDNKDSLSPSSPVDKFIKHVSKISMWNWKADSLLINQSKTLIIDNNKSQGGKIDVNNIHLKLSNITSDSNDVILINGAMNLWEKGTLNLKGNAKLFPISADLDLKIDTLNLTVFQAWADMYTWVTMRKGSLNLDSKIKYRTTKNSTQDTLKTTKKAKTEVTDTLDITSNVYLKNLSFSSRNSREFIKVQSMDMNDIHIDAVRKEANIKNVITRNSIIRVNRNKDGDIDLLGLLKKSRPKLEKEYVDQIKVFQSDITLTRLVNGNISIVDDSPISKFSLSVNNINGRVRNFSSRPWKTSSFDFTGKVNNNAPFKITGKGKLTAKPIDLDIEIESKNQELPFFSPYSGTYAGYNIQKGLGHVNFKYSIKNSSLVGQNHIVLDQMAFGEKVKSEDAIKLPVKLGLALLTDRRGIVDLDFGIEGDIKDPKFKMSALIFKVIKNLLEKAVTKPFDALVGAFTSDEKPDQITFNPGTSEIPTKEVTLIKKIAEEMRYRAGLVIEVEGHWDPNIDEKFLKEEKLKIALSQKSGLDSIDFSKENLKAKEIQTYVINYHNTLFPDTNKIAIDSNSIALNPAKAIDSTKLANDYWDKLIALQKINPEEIKSLKLNRANAVKLEFLKTDFIEANRIFIIKTPETQEEKIGVFAKLNLKAK